jgi:hypothetical protein
MKTVLDSFMLLLLIQIKNRADTNHFGQQKRESDKERPAPGEQSTGRILSAFFSNVPVCLTPDKSHVELVAEILHVFIYFLAKMVQEMIHLLALGFAELLRYFGPLRVDFLEILIRETADFHGLLLGDVPGMGEHRCKNTRHVLHFLVRHCLTSAS